MHPKSCFSQDSPHAYLEGVKIGNQSFAASQKKHTFETNVNASGICFLLCWQLSAPQNILTPSLPKNYCNSKFMYPSKKCWPTKGHETIRLPFGVNTGRFSKANVLFWFRVVINISLQSFCSPNTTNPNK